MTKPRYLVIWCSIVMLIAGCNKNKEEFLNAIQSHDWDTAEKLLTTTPDLLNIRLYKDKGCTLLHAGVSENDKELLVFLLRYSVDVNAATKEEGETPLHWAARGRNADIVALLLEKGADVNRRDEGLDTPLHEACLSPTKEIVALLISNGAQIDAKEHMGQTPLCYACTSLKETDDVLKTMHLLLSSGADPNADCFPKHSIIQGTIASGHFKKAQLLEDYGAVLELMTDKGMQPFKVEEAKQIYETNEELLKRVGTRD